MNTQRKQILKTLQITLTKISIQYRTFTTFSKYNFPNLLKNEENNRFSLRCFPHFSVLLVYSFLPLTFPVSSATTITAPVMIVYRNPNEIFRLFSRLPFQQTYATISIRKQTSSCLQPYLFNPISFSEPVSGNFFRQ